ncbi:hypothetical protein RchiOBHm_Chr1g0344651 [Rosa chinensis]|uniref:Uncharacterized protein n=1 Tax=Rosa chinensis TaxID=74649 RepID=A0A2P6SEJ6_ROSCH|nr:hypothetical protein RchiOBHm_Chr1g0344651 [Rosa chinensis]
MNPNPVLPYNHIFSYLSSSTSGSLSLLEDELHSVGNCCPQSPEFPSNEVRSLKVRNWLVDGIGPEKLLCDKFNLLSEVMEVMLEGIGPNRWLLERSRASNRCKLPIPSGIFPVKWLCDKFKLPKAVRFVISFGISPHRLLLDRSILVSSFTRYAV